MKQPTEMIEGQEAFEQVAQSPRFWDTAALLLRRAEFGL